MFRWIKSQDVTVTTFASQEIMNQKLIFKVQKVMSVNIANVVNKFQKVNRCKSLRKRFFRESEVVNSQVDLCLLFKTR